MFKLRQKLSSRVMIALLVAGLSVSVATKPAYAMDRDVKTVIKYGGYGILVGTGVGLITWPFTQDLRAVFMGTSIGLYLGIAIGIYQVFNRENPQNPLNQMVSQMVPMQSLASFIPESQKITGAGSLYQSQAFPQPQFRFDVPVLRF